MTSELDELFPAPRRLRLLGQEIAIRPSGLDRLRAVSAVIDAWQRVLTAPAPVAALAAEAGALAAAMAEITGLPEGDLAACPADELPAYVEAINAVVVLNAGFFVRRVLPALMAGHRAAHAAVRTPDADGPMSSPGSSGAGTTGTP